MQSKQTLFAYAQGTDLEGVNEPIEAALDALVTQRKWTSKDVWVVNQREPPYWDLGLNIALAPANKRPKRWTDDVVVVAKALGKLHRETKRAFIIGVHDAATDTTKDLFVVDRDEPNLAELLDALGR